MASSTVQLLLLLFLALLTLFCNRANARPSVHFHPCMTHFISSFKSPLQLPQLPGSTRYQDPINVLSLYSEVDVFEARPIYPSSDISIHCLEFPRSTRLAHFSDGADAGIPHPVLFRSASERMEDILQVMVALLLGVGCGSLTSTAMYLVWVLMMSRCGRRELDGEDDNGVGVNSKGMEYVNFPALAKQGCDEN